MTSWKRPGSANNKPPSLSLRSSLHDKLSDQEGLSTRLGTASLLSQTLVLTNKSWNPGRGQSLLKTEESDGWKGPGNIWSSP